MGKVAVMLEVEVIFWIGFWMVYSWRWVLKVGKGSLKNVWGVCLEM